VNYTTTYDGQAFLAALGTYFACIAVFVIAVIALQIVAYWKILTKAGYNGAWSLLLLIPGINGFASIGILLFLAFSEWPAMRPAYAPTYAPPYVPPPTYGPPPTPQPGYAPPPSPMAEQPAPAPFPSAPPAAPAEPAPPAEGPDLGFEPKD
jgi:hypothetical protein